MIEKFIYAFFILIGTPLLLTYYDPVNEIGYAPCDSDCSRFAHMREVDETAFDEVAACIPQWGGATVSWDGREYICDDAGADVVIEFNEYHERWVIRIDLVTDLSVYPPNEYPPDNYSLVWEYDVRN